MSRARGLIGGATAGAVASGATRLAYTVLNQRPPGGTKTWSRTNHRGEAVTLLEGPAVAAGAARLAYPALNQHPPGGTKTWSRVNHRGEQLTLLEGPAA
ncbi:MAG TPA: hypothetical protein VJ351_05300, partial [Streptosporangiaceae bacterium]|nr:hypothetical protein [Streptosporangiaceae bacterium]